LIDAAIAREWLTGLGRRDAYARVAHLICEQYHRMKAVELAQKDILEFPVTQAEIADALGLSTVHVNRTMKSLSRDKLISYHNHSITVLNWQTLQKAAQFARDNRLCPDWISAGGGTIIRDYLPPRERRPSGVPDGTKLVFFCREFFQKFLCPSFEGVGVMRERAGRRGSPSTFSRRNTAPEQITLPWMLEVCPL
jgi:hypothetical protein